MIKRSLVDETRSHFSEYKKTLAESLKKIMRKKSFSKITVSEIIADCGVNRKTFYYHFQDIYDLLRWMFEKEAVEVVKQLDLILNYEEALLFVMDYVEENEYIINCAYDAMGRDGMKQYFFSDFTLITQSLIESVEKELGKTLDESYKTFLTKFYTEAFTGVLVDWVKNRKERNREQLIDYFVTTVKSSLMGIFQEEAPFIKNNTMNP